MYESIQRLQDLLWWIPIATGEHGSQAGRRDDSTSSGYTLPRPTVDRSGPVRIKTPARGTNQSRQIRPHVRVKILSIVTLSTIGFLYSTGAPAIQRDRNSCDRECTGVERECVSRYQVGFGPYNCPIVYRNCMKRCMEPYYIRR